MAIRLIGLIYMWIIFALSASLMWGLTYVINEQVYKKISVVTSLSITSFAMFVVMLVVACSQGLLKKDLSVISSSKNLMFLVLVETITLILAELSIGFAITNKNATLAGLIEISYPIFITLFAYFIFKENGVSLSTIIGGLLIFIGVFIIYYFNK